MANGDDAAAAGMDVVPGTDPARDGYDDINQTRDYIVAYATRSAAAIDIWTGPTDPGHAPGRVWIKTAG